MPKNKSQPPIECQNNFGTVVLAVSFRAKREISVPQCERFLGATLRLGSERRCFAQGAPRNDKCPAPPC